MENSGREPGFFVSLMDWLFDRARGLSAAWLVGVIGWQVYSGMYDWNAVTTADVQRSPTSWVGREIVLSNVSIRKYEINEDGADTFVRLWLVNGITNPPVDQKPMLVVGRMPTATASRFESLPWWLKNGIEKLARARVAIGKNITVLREYSLFSDLSWFETPYALTVSISNHFFPLRTFIWVGVAVHAVVYGVIAALVAQGLVYVMPKVD